MLRSHLFMKNLCGLIDSSSMEESSLVSVTVKISFDIIKSTASNHLDSRLLQFQVHSQTNLLVVLETDLDLVGFKGTVDHLD